MICPIDDGLVDAVRSRESDNALSRAVSESAVAEYRSRFRGWDRRASVRTKPAPLLSPGDNAAYFFPPRLVPVAAHPVLTAGDPERIQRLLVHRLIQYLHFTTELEQIAVIPVTIRLGRGRAGLRLPATMREDAHKITTDEAWHAQFSYDMITKVVGATRVPVRVPPVAQFARRLGAIHRRIDPDLRHLDDLVFGVVSETLISGFLAVLPKDPGLPAAVRGLVADHAEDEGRHHAYFRSLLEFIWPALSGRQRRLIGPWLPEFIYAFLEPDYGAIAYALLEVGLSDAEVAAVLHESYLRPAVTADVADGAKATIGYFAAVGALDDPGTRDAFQRAGLIPSA